MAVLAAAIPVAGTHLREALAGMERFRVEHVEVEGLRYLDHVEVEAALALPVGASVWHDPSPWEAAVERHPLVRSADVRRRLPSTLVVRIEERRPVALVPAPTLEPVDDEGRRLPLDPAVHSLDLPLLRVAHADGVAASPAEGPGGAWDRVESSRAMGGWSAGTGSRPVRVLAGEAARLAEAEPSFVADLSELEWTPRGDVVARWGEGSVTIRFRPPLAPGRLREAMTVLADAAARRPGRSVRAVDLRFEDQVVVTYAGPGRS